MAKAKNRDEEFARKHGVVFARGYMGKILNVDLTTGRLEDVLGIPLETLAVSDVTAQGAALLAGIGIGMFADEVQAVARAYRVATRYEVDSKKHAQYDAAYCQVTGCCTQP